MPPHLASQEALRRDKISRASRLLSTALVLITVLLASDSLSQTLENFRQSLVARHVLLTPALGSTPTSLLESCSLVAVELGFHPDWWLTRIVGTSFVLISTFMLMLTIGFSVVFQILCMMFVVWKKWSSLHTFVAHTIRHTDSRLGVF